METFRVGLVGVGNISGIYLRNLTSFHGVEVAAVSDLNVDRARAVAQDYSIPKALSPDELLDDPAIDLVVNLTIPAVHAEVSLRAVQSGKHVYSEKPLAITREDAQSLLTEARARNLRVGCAPDTFLGAGIQTAIHALQSGLIGEPVAASGQFLARGPEPWHPNPNFFYQPGGGPMLDMGPYYITALVSLLGPIRRVSGSARPSYRQRPIPLSNAAYYARPDVVKPDEGPAMIDVETSTHYAAVLDFANGAIANFTTSFDVTADWLTHPIVIYGTKGTLKVPDPNTFGGDVMATYEGSDGWEKLPHVHAFSENARGLGVMDIVLAIQSGQPHRASGDLAYHVLDAMLAVQDASDTGTYQILTSQMPPVPAVDGAAYARAVANPSNWSES